jgi:diguanylate cyclase (GGDEF)-like protein
MVFSTGIGGFVPGLSSAVVMFLYSMFFFSTDHSFFSYTDLNLQKILIILLGILLNLTCVSLLRRSRDRATRKLMQANAQLADANARLAQAATTDALTGLRNRHALNQDARLYLGHSLHLMLMDLDNFKYVNDTLGHSSGDNLLRRTGQVLTEVFGPDNCYRYGGDEFLVISENCTDAQFRSLYEEATRRLSGIQDGTQSSVTFSGGFVTGVPASTEHLQQMFLQADSNLYQAKQDGKNGFFGSRFDPDPSVPPAP